MRITHTGRGATSVMSSRIFSRDTNAPHLSTPGGERARDGGIEAEANFLAGTLLITNEAAVYIVRQGLVRMAQGVYGVSGPMLDYRLRVSGAYTIQRRRAGL